jgi:exodeoxyribonuclease V alpha subunit
MDILRADDARRQHAPETVTVRGVLTDIIATRLNDDGDSGWASLRFCCDDGRSVKVVADDTDVNTLQRGTRFKVIGLQEDDPRWGPQIRGHMELDPSGLDPRGLRAFLVEHVVGVGATRAYRLVDAYGHLTVTTLRDDPARVVADKLLPEAVAQAASQYLLRAAPDLAEAMAEVYQLLAPANVPGWRRPIRRIMRRYRRAAPGLLRDDPLRVALDRLLPFPIADHLFQQMGGNLADPFRHLAALNAMLAEDISGTWYTPQTVPREFRGRHGVEVLNLRAAVKYGVEEGRLALEPLNEGTRVIALASRAEDEQRLAKAVRALLARPGAWPDTSGCAITRHQQEALTQALAGGGLAILTGPPGVGKTLVAREVIRQAVTQGQNVFCVAPTGKASQRLREMLLAAGLSSVVPSTVHRLLGAAPRDDGTDGFSFTRGPHAPLERGLFVVDETSMLDAHLARHFFEAVPSGSVVLLLGDVEQLPSVGHGRVLHDLIEGGVPVGRLEECHRSGGLIWQTIDAIRHRRPLPPLPPRLGGDVAWLRARDDGERMAHLAESLAWLEERGIAPSDIQVISATNRVCAVVNAALQARWNPGDGEAPGRPRPGDRVINRKNRFLPGAEQPRRGLVLAPSLIFSPNGEQGQLEAIGEDRTGLVRLAGGELVATHIPAKGQPRLDIHGNPQGPPDRYGEWSLSYAVTAHRSQGSEWAVTAVLIEDVGITDRSWLYTAISRARQHVILIGSGQALEGALSWQQADARITLLARQLRGAQP